MKTLTIIRGLPGSGKSSYAEYVSNFSGAVICTADDYFINEKGEYKWDVTKLGKAHDFCKNMCENAMIENKDVIVANTSTTEKELNPYLSMAEKYGYKVFSIIVENRHGNKNIHSVPDEKLVEMKNRFHIKLL